MKKYFLSFLLLSAALCAGCGEEDLKDEKNNNGNDSGIVDFSKISNKVYYQYDLEDEEKTKKVIRTGFENIDTTDYAIPDLETFNYIHEFEWFVPNLRFEADKFYWAWDSGFITIIDPVDPFTATFEYGVEVYSYDYKIFTGRYFDDDFNEIIFSENIILYKDDKFGTKIYYSEDYLKKQGIEFFDAADVMENFK